MRERKRRRRGETQVRAGHRMAHLAKLPKLRRAVRTDADMRLDRAGARHIEFAVDQAMQQHLCFIARHHCAFSSADSHAARNIERARANRDITVPTGTPAISAISLYDRSLTLAQHDRLAKSLGNALTMSRMDCSSRRRSITRLRRLRRFAPQRHRIFGELLIGKAAWRVSWLLQTLRKIANSHGRIGATAERIEMLQRAQVALLHGVVGIGSVPQ